jgi:hypothetical protein
MSYKKGEEPQVDVEFSQKLDIIYVVLEQIRRVLAAASEGDEGKYNNCVEELLNLLPSENRFRLESDKIKGEYIETVEQPVYKYSCGYPMGTVEKPVFRNNPWDWNYHGGPPELVSPIMEEVEQTDYNKLFKLIMSEFEEIGVSWKVEPKGNVDKRIDPLPRPVFLEARGLGVEAGLEQVELEDGVDG